MFKSILRAIRDARPYAFALGLIEHWNGCGGRTHETIADWNEAYDSGMNLADKLRGRGAG